MAVTIDGLKELSEMLTHESVRTAMGDTVPAMLTPGETVVTKQLTEQVKNSGSGRRGGDVHVHTTVNAVDAAGFEGLLNKHASIVSKHVRNQMRKQNKGG